MSSVEAWQRRRAAGTRFIVKGPHPSTPGECRQLVEDALTAAREGTAESSRELALRALGDGARETRRATIPPADRSCQCETMARELAILALDGCMASAVAGVLDVLQVANGIVLGGGGSAVFSVRVATLSGADAVGFGGVPIVADASLAELTDVDVAVLPPVLDGLDESLAANADLIVWLKRRAAEGVLLTSVCTGAYFLAEAGVLDGRRATTYPGRAMSFRRRYPGVMLEPDRRIVDEGSVISAGATTSYLDLALYLVERYAGHAVAVVTAKVLAVDKNRLTQRPYFLFADQRDHGDTAVLEVQDWIEEHHREDVDIRQLASRFAMSVRTLNRRFRAATGETPVTYLHRVRIEAAKRLVDETTSTVDEITTAVGYGDPRSFGRLFRRHTGTSPREYRRRFGVLSPDGLQRNDRIGPETVHSDPAGPRANPHTLRNHEISHRSAPRPLPAPEPARECH